MYRLSRALWARTVGSLTVALGVLVLVVSLTVNALGGASRITLGVAGVGVVALAAGSWWWQRLPVLTIDAEGYAVRGIRGAGVRQARWRDVANLKAMTIARTPVLVVQLNGGGETTLPVGAIAGDREELARELTSRARKAQGLRPL